MRKRVSYITVLCLIAGLTSCDDAMIYEKNVGFENNTWVYEDPKTFSFEITDSLLPVKLSINLRTTTNYPYSNIYMFLHSNYPNGYHDIDTLEFFLADPRGNWLGDNSGTVVENRAVISKGVFPTTGTYHFMIEQAMRNDSLPEIIDLGLRVEVLSEND
ncbi:MAG: gliding motility lipoprotein GldH [Putridiphycobacter sp.]|nr:gliding motility lipoprotein GldH [Putridiphycobacter sp.]